MTSMPASRSARAMIFAPRSCPSRPGFAITTRIVPGTSADYRGASDRHRLVAGVAEPGERAFRLHAPGRREPRPTRLRAGRPRSPSASTRNGRTSTRSRSPTSTSTTGAISCRGCGARFYLASRRPVSQPGAVGPARWARELLAALGERLGFPDMFERTFRPLRVRARHAVRNWKLVRHADTGSSLPARDVRVPRSGERSCACLLGRLRAVG